MADRREPTARSVSEVRILAQTAAGGTVLVAVEGDELPVGGFDPSFIRRSASTTRTETS